MPAETATDASTIDFLKKNNKRNKRRILAAILIVTLLLGSIWGYRTYFYPAPLKNTALIDYAVTVKDNKTIQIKGSLTDQTLGVAGIDSPVIRITRKPSQSMSEPTAYRQPGTIHFPIKRQKPMP